MHLDTWVKLYDGWLWSFFQQKQLKMEFWWPKAARGIYESITASDLSNQDKTEILEYMTSHYEELFPMSAVRFHEDYHNLWRLPVCRPATARSGGSLAKGRTVCCNASAPVCEDDNCDGVRTSDNKAKCRKAHEGCPCKPTAKTPIIPACPASSDSCQACKGSVRSSGSSRGFCGGDKATCPCTADSSTPGFCAKKQPCAATDCAGIQTGKMGGSTAICQAKKLQGCACMPDKDTPGHCGKKPGKCNHGTCDGKDGLCTNDYKGCPCTGGTRGGHCDKAVLATCMSRCYNSCGRAVDPMFCYGK